MEIERTEGVPDAERLERPEGVSEIRAVPAGRPVRELLSEEDRPDLAQVRPSDEKMISIRLAPERFDVLEMLASRQGLAATTMARMLLHRALREAEESGGVSP